MRASLGNDQAYAKSLDTCITRSYEEDCHAKVTRQAKN